MKQNKMEEIKFVRLRDYVSLIQMMKYIAMFLPGVVGLLIAMAILSSPVTGSVSIIRRPPEPTPTTVDSEDPSAELIRQHEQMQKQVGSMNSLNLMSDQNKISHPALKLGLDQLIHHPRRMVLVYAEIGWVVVMLILRAWLSSRVTHWFRKLMVRAGAFSLYVLGGSFLIPAIVLGDSYMKFVQRMIEVMKLISQKQ